ncbi:hypothetical protein GQ44DRAFT_283193 [Phaeosphaeriaceae sp. PMI808]|nr:hypothetical protein GQ44DRAFT_283193 [Phaeosphaeriaceae sp. PMI808]
MADFSPFVASQGLVTGCVVCARKNNLSRCSACKVVSYCGHHHQASDRPAHKSFCNKIKKAQAKFDEEDAALRAHPGDWMLPANPLESEQAIGHFWGLIDTRDYMRARFAVVDAQLKVNTSQAVETALDHMLDMLRLCRSDNMGLRDIVPALFLRLNRDQECYDFCKWWYTTGSEMDYDWGDTSLPYLDIKNADVFEPADLYIGEYPSLSPTVAITLLKIRLLMDLQTVRRAQQEAGPYVPQEILDTIRGHAVSSIIAGNRGILDGDQTPHINILEKQIKQLFEAVNEVNKHFWPAMLEPGQNITTRPQYYGIGDREEMQIKLQYWYNAWVETPGAIGVVKELLKK